MASGPNLHLQPIHVQQVVNAAVESLVTAIDGIKMNRDLAYTRNELGQYGITVASQQASNSSAGLAKDRTIEV